MKGDQVSVLCSIHQYAKKRKKGIISSYSFQTGSPQSHGLRVHMLMNLTGQIHKGAVMHSVRARLKIRLVLNLVPVQKDT